MFELATLVNQSAPMLVINFNDLPTLYGFGLSRTYRLLCCHDFFIHFRVLKYNLLKLEESCKGIS